MPTFGHHSLGNVYINRTLSSEEITEFIRDWENTFSEETFKPFCHLYLAKRSKEARQDVAKNRELTLNLNYMYAQFM